MLGVFKPGVLGVPNKGVLPGVGVYEAFRLLSQLFTPSLDVASFWAAGDMLASLTIDDLDSPSGRGLRTNIYYPSMMVEQLYLLIKAAVFRLALS